MGKRTIHCQVEGSVKTAELIALIDAERTAWTAERQILGQSEIVDAMLPT